MHVSILLLSAILLTCQTWALQMSDRFTVSSTCASREVDLLIKETVELADTAIDSLQRLLNAGSNANPDSNDVELKRFLYAAHTMFGVIGPKDYKDGFSKLHEDHLKFVKGNIEIIRDTLKHGKGVNRDSNFFHCDGKLFKRADKASDVLNRDKYPADNPDITLRELYSNEPGLAFVWKDPDHRISTGYNFLPNFGNDNPYCAGGNDGSFTAVGPKLPSKNLVICPLVWNSPNKYKRSLADIKDLTGTRKWSDVSNRPASFLHEMLHWIWPQRSITDHRVNGQLMQGFAGCYALANMMGQQGFYQSATNADSYAIYATQVYMKNANLVA